MDLQKFKENPREHCPAPSEIMRMAKDYPHVQTCVNAWESGRCTWEQAMTAAVAALINLVLDDPWRKKDAS